MNCSNFSTASLELIASQQAEISPKRLIRSHRSDDSMYKIPVYASVATNPASTLGRKAIFRRDGDVWTLSYEQKTVRLRDIKGLSYIARLLSQPDTEIHAIELARTAEPGVGPGDATIQVTELENIGAHFGDLGNAGEMLDKQAREAYRRRISELRDEQAEARAQGQVDRAEAAELEIDSLIAELSRATGLGGRSRVAASIPERARQSVTRAIRSALSRIADCHPSLGQVLARQIKTGIYCSYQPDPNSAVLWSLAATASEEASPLAGRPTEETMPHLMTGESGRFPRANVIGLILEPSWNQGMKPLSEEARVALDQITPVLGGALFQMSPQFNPSRSTAAIGNVIVLAINSAPLLESIGALMKQSREKHPV